MRVLGSRQFAMLTLGMSVPLLFSFQLKAPPPSSEGASQDGSCPKAWQRLQHISTDIFCIAFGIVVAVWNLISPKTFP